MSDANGEFVKIYLYLLRLMNAPDTAFSISSIADKFEHTEKDIKRALSYWERMHLLRLEYDASENLTGICLLDSVPRDASAESSPAPLTEQAAPDSGNASGSQTPSSGTPAPVQAGNISRNTTAPSKKSYSADDIRQFRKDESVAEMFFITERYLNRTLSATDINTILYLFDVLKFSSDLIVYLVEYCVSKGHTSIRYIEKVALGWADSGITTVAGAKEAASLHSKSYFAVMKALGISGRNLVPSETRMIEKWKSEYGFDEELIEEACRRTIQATHQPSFEYTDSILTNWHKKQIRTLTDVATEDALHQSRKKSAASAESTSAAPSRNRFNNFTQRSYDYDQLEKMLLTTTTR